MTRRLPALRPRQVIRAPRRPGFVLRRVTGSHYRLIPATDPSRWVVVAYHNRDLEPKTLGSITMRPGLTIGELVDLL